MDHKEGTEEKKKGRQRDLVPQVTIPTNEFGVMGAEVTCNSEVY